MVSGEESLGRGSQWQRWEPHTHAPGTLFNDLFADDWEGYISKLERQTPAICAVGVTDYYLTDKYQQVCAAKAEGRLKDCDLIFPNVELRLSIGAKKAFLNIHLLVDPTDPDHLKELDRFLEGLTFEAFGGETFRCRRSDLIRLGRRATPQLAEESQALKKGAEQFKVDFNELRRNYDRSGWAINNILVAVAGGTNDGTAGLQEASDATLRAEIQRFAHIVFSGNPKDRDFWLGLGALCPDEIRFHFGELKPCMHGSDAHSLERVGAPAGNRYTWVKGISSFDTLRQACVDPNRAYVGEKPPMGATPSQTIDTVTISGAPWARSPVLRLNPGLVAVIGPRGSGKTALADIIARGCDATAERLSPQSFIVRAKHLLAGASVSLTWADGAESDLQSLNTSESLFGWEPPRARYLSQKFVEDLCSSDGMTDDLLREIERVVFDAHPFNERESATNFQEMVDLKAGRYRDIREREEIALANVSDRLGTEIEKERLVESLSKQVTDKEKLIARYVADRAKLLANGSEERLARLEAVTAAAEVVRGYMRVIAAREHSFQSLRDEVDDSRSNQFPEALRRTIQAYAASGLKGDEWDPFALTYRGDVDAAVNTGLEKTKASAASWRGQAPAIREDLNVPYVGADADLQRTPLALLEAEIGRLQQLVGSDRAIASQFVALSRRIDEENAALARLKEKLEDCKQAKERIANLRVDRQAGYARVFEAVVSEQNVLSDLYAPIMKRICGAPGALNKLNFTVRRVANVEQWANQGEALLDLRRQGPFKGRGKLRERAEKLLKQSWETGSVQDVVAAMTQFREETTAEDLRPLQRFDADFRIWAKNFAQWLYRTDHISIRYSVDYEGVDIQNLSPGTRGIVLLLLYLALDDADDRPLIIDQPEENLDPKSIFDELVPLFVRAKESRQVIVVTHNANLVVNTDADQVIIADAGPSVDRQLPPIKYMAGGLEETDIRTAVCKILEGGEPAFKERARRLRIALSRR